MVIKSLTVTAPVNAADAPLLMVKHQWLQPGAFAGDCLQPLGVRGHGRVCQLPLQGLEGPAGRFQAFAEQGGVHGLGVRMPPERQAKRLGGFQNKSRMPRRHPAGRKVWMPVGQGASAGRDWPGTRLRLFSNSSAAQGRPEELQLNRTARCWLRDNRLND